MKPLLFIAFLAISACLFGQLHTINPVIGDESYLVKYGVKPEDGCDETDRIRTHLSYVEEKLRVSDVSALTAEQQEKRTEILDHLRDYWQRGQFPLNSKYETERRPCFIDEKGTICAVGYLIGQTAGPEAAEAINDQYQYATIAEMTDKLPEIEQWATENGLTVSECAMIQPAYDFIRAEPRNRIGMYAGYTSAFAMVDESSSGGAVNTKPGFEAALTHTYWLKYRVRIQTSFGYVSRNFSVSGSGQTFEQRNDRWFISSLVWMSPFSKARMKWLQKTSVKAGVQIDLYNQNSPMTVFDNAHGTWNKVAKTNRPECLLVGELSYGLRPFRFIYTNQISLSYSYGLRNTLKGEVGTPLETALRYSSSGSYLSLKYTFWLRSPRRY